MPTIPELEAYRLSDQDWESYEQLCDEFEWEIPDAFNMASYVCDRWADEDPDRIAIYATDDEGETGRYTFGELREAANSLANFLDGRGVTRGDRIGVSGSQRPETLISHIAAWKLGAVSVPLSVLLGPEGLAYRMNDAGTVAVVGFGENADAIRSVRDEVDTLETVVQVDEAAVGDHAHAFADVVAEASSSFETRETASDEEGIIFYTSGTTGNPKGVVHSHDTLLGVLPSLMAVHDLVVDENEVYRTVTELSWVGALMDVSLPSLYYGIPLVMNARKSFEPEKEFDLIEAYGITVIWISPTALRMMMQVEDAGERWDLSSVRVIGSGGESLGDSIFSWADEVFDGANVHEGYGQTEAPTAIGDCTALGVPHRLGKMGKAHPGYEVAVLDPETGEPTVERGEIGELGLRADNPVCFDRYLNRPDATAEKIQDGWLMGEDLISIDEDGYIAFHSRKDDVIISSGYRMGPTEIEDTVTTHDAVANAGVIGVPHETRGEIPKAFVVLVDGYEPSDDLKSEIQSHVKERLAKYEYPREIEFVDELPQTNTGKVRRRDLRDQEGLIEE